MRGALLALAASALLAAPALAQDGPPLPLPIPPAQTNSTGFLLFDTMLAIARRQQAQPAAAQAATFAYTKALERYRSGDLAGADRAAIEALAALARAPQGAPAPVASAPFVAPAPPRASLSGGSYGADAPTIDAEAFLALTRGALRDCAERRSPNLPAAQAAYAQAERALAARNPQAVRIGAKAAIDLCARAAR